MAGRIAATSIYNTEDRPQVGPGLHKPPQAHFQAVSAPEARLKSVRHGVGLTTHPPEANLVKRPKPIASRKPFADHPLDHIFVRHPETGAHRALVTEGGGKVDLGFVQQRHKHTAGSGGHVHLYR